MRMPINVSSIWVSNLPSEACTSLASLLSFLVTAAMATAEIGITSNVNKCKLGRDRKQGNKISDHHIGFFEKHFQRAGSGAFYSMHVTVEP